MSKFSIGDSVTTFDPNFQPLVPLDTVGSITKVYNDHTEGIDGYDVLLRTEEGTHEEFFFMEYELSEVN